MSCGRRTKQTSNWLLPYVMTAHSFSVPDKLYENAKGNNKHDEQCPRECLCNFHFVTVCSCRGCTDEFIICYEGRGSGLTITVLGSCPLARQAIALYVANDIPSKWFSYHTQLKKRQNALTLTMRPLLQLGLDTVENKMEKEGHTQPHSPENQVSKRFRPRLCPL